MRLLLVLLLCIQLAGCKALEKAKPEIIRLGLAFVAKGMCSCVFVVEQPESFCEDYASLKQVNPKITVNRDKHIVTASFLGVFKRSAVYNGPEEGCAIQ